MNQGGALTGSLKLRELADKHYAALVDELTAHLDSELKAARDKAADEVSAAVAEVSAKERLQAASQVEAARAEGTLQAKEASRHAGLEARVSLSESLNQIVRRIRQTSDGFDVLDILLDSAATFARQAVVLGVENNQVQSMASIGLKDREFAFPLASAAAVSDVCQSRDPLVAVVSEQELSSELAEALADPADPQRKAYLFPIVARQEVIAVLIVCGEDTVPAAIELLSEAAGMKIEALEPPPTPELKPLPPSPGLVQIAQPAGAPAEAQPVAALAWTDLSPDDQKLHLQAQRVARVKVAEMRLYQADTLRKGVFEANIYGRLGNEIDRARAEFLQSFLSKLQTMVDYLHLEILRSLAHDDNKLLGPDYPGPMV